MVALACNPTKRACAVVRDSVACSVDGSNVRWIHFVVSLNPWCERVETGEILVEGFDMTHDERIEAMARAIFDSDFLDEEKWSSVGKVYAATYRRMATAALAAAGVEEMVREAAIEAWQAGAYSASEYYKGGGFDPAAIATIVREVMGK